jgi:hypothetical protein
MPLIDHKKEDMIAWLEQIIGQYKRGELFSSSIIELHVSPKK